MASGLIGLAAFGVVHSYHDRLEAFEKIMKRRESDLGENQIERVRRICLALPETWEKISHGEPTWFVGKKVFATLTGSNKSLTTRYRRWF